MIPKLKTRAEIFLSPPEKLKDGNKIIIDKKRDNFRVPLEMPFDPKFWPARGRRNNDVTNNNHHRDDKNCIFIYDDAMTSRHDFSKRSPFVDFSIVCDDKKIHDFKIKFDDVESNGQNDFFDKYPPPIFNGNCPVNVIKQILSRYLKELLLMKLNESKNSEVSRTSSSLTSSTTDDDVKDVAKKKYVIYLDLPEFMKNLFDKPDNNEKEKKQDVFWAARGKKSSSM